MISSLYKKGAEAKKSIFLLGIIGLFFVGALPFHVHAQSDGDFGVGAEIQQSTIDAQVATFTQQAQAAATKAATDAAAAQQCAAQNNLSCATSNANLASQDALAAKSAANQAASLAVPPNNDTANASNVAVAQIANAQANNSATQAESSSAAAANAAGNSGVAAQEAAAAGQQATVANAAAAASASASQSATASAAATNGSGNTCSLTAGNFNIFSCMIQGLAYFIFQIAATVLGFVGLLFNWVVTVTVFEFGTYFANSPGMLAAWGILRDIGNIVILFGFIFMGIMMILDLDSFNVRKALPRLLIFAVLLNFSLFASEAVVDVANSLSSAFYVATNNTGNCSGAAALQSTCASTGIAGSILTATGLSTIWNAGSPDLKKLSSSDSALPMLMLSLFLIIVSIILIAGTIMFFSRAVVLAFLLVVSPLGFAGMAVPMFQKQAAGWWNKLISEAFFAPVFLLLIFIGLKLANIIQPGGISFADTVFNPNASNIGLIFLFVLVCSFMIAALVVARNMGAMGADFVMNTSKNVATRTLGEAAFGGAAWVGRNTVGQAGNIASRAIASPNGWAQSNPNLARFMYGFTNKAATSSFDPRATSLVKSAAKSAKIDVGTANKKASHGIHGIHEEAEKTRVDFVEKVLKPSEKQKALVNELRLELEDIKEKNKKELKPHLDGVEAQQKVVEKARIKGDQAELDQQRAILADRQRDYNTASSKLTTVGTKENPNEKGKYYKEELKRQTCEPRELRLRRTLMKVLAGTGISTWMEGMLMPPPQRNCARAEA
jgi:hypothetical protein